MNMETNVSTPSGARESIGRYTAKAYLWMFLGLVITFVVSLITIDTGLFFYLYGTFDIWCIIVLAVVEIALVLILSTRLKKLSVAAATTLFLIYAVINGLTFSSIFVVYEVTSIIWTFAAAAAMYGVMGAWGYFTKQDLSSWRKVLLFGLLGLIFMGVLGLFMNLSSLELIISFVGVAIFLGFTAYDTQKIKAFYAYFSEDTAMLKKASIISALELYLDFINLFLYLLRIFGKKN